MARPKKLITEQEVTQAILVRETLKDWKIINRLSAIIAYATNSAKEVAKIFGVTSVTIIYWAHAFHENGIQGLYDAEKGHRAKKLSGHNAEVVKDWVISSQDSKGNRVHWTLKKLCIEIKKVLGIELAYSTLSYALAEMQLVLKRPRPMDYKQDPEKAEEFKKKPLR